MNLDNAIENIKRIKGIGSDKEVADLLELSAADFSNRKKRGTLLPLILEWAEHENVNFDTLLKGAVQIVPGNHDLVRELASEYQVSAVHRTLSKEENDLLELLRAFPDAREAMMAFMQLPPRKQKIYLGKLLEEVERLEEAGELQIGKDE